MTHTEGDRVEFDPIDQAAPIRGVIVKVRRSPTDKHDVLEYIVHGDDDHSYFVPPQHLYPERTTT